jgi:hypothetical protein
MRETVLTVYGGPSVLSTARPQQGLLASPRSCSRGGTAQ